MRNYAFCYKVKFYNIVDEKEESGLLIANSFVNAVSQIEGYYEDDLLAIISLEIGQETDLIALPEEICRNYIEDKY